jgi:hypothetical protein
MLAEQFQNEDTALSEGARPVPRPRRVGYEIAVRLPEHTDRHPAWKRLWSSPFCCS